MPVNIDWEDGGANIHVLCDSCDREYNIMTSDIKGLELCSFCGQYLEVKGNEGIDERQEDSWD